MNNSRKRKEFQPEEYQDIKQLQGCTNIVAVSDKEREVFNKGDLVMSTAGHINHPAAVKHNLISRSYILIGSVVGHRTQDWSKGCICHFDDVIVNWQNLELNNNRYQDRYDGIPIYFDGGRCYNLLVEFDFIHCSKLSLLADRKSNNLSGLNSFIEVEALKHFHHTKNGWLKKPKICHIRTVKFTEENFILTE